MIGILGGTFDPIHLGHIQIATQVFTRLQLEQVQFMPCALPVHRDQPQASAAQRCAMIELEIADRPGFTLNQLEVERDGPSYSIDSLREIRRCSDVGLALILGTDAFNGFANWKSTQDILRLAHLIVCRRPGVDCDANSFHDRRVDSANALPHQAAGAIVMLDVEANDCSSSRVRSRLAAGEVPGECVSTAVANYIDEHLLYRSLSA